MYLKIRFRFILRGGFQGKRIIPFLGIVRNSDIVGYQAAVGVAGAVRMDTYGRNGFPAAFKVAGPVFRKAGGGQGYIQYAVKKKKKIIESSSPPEAKAGIVKTVARITAAKAARTFLRIQVFLCVRSRDSFSVEISFL